MINFVLFLAESEYCPASSSLPGSVASPAVTCPTLGISKRGCKTGKCVLGVCVSLIVYLVIVGEFVNCADSLVCVCVCAFELCY